MNQFENIRHRAGAAALLLPFLGMPGHAQQSASIAFDTPTVVPATAEDTSIRPFQVHIPESTLADLRQRLAAARLPEPETDPGQGVRLATMKELLRHWQTDYDWRKAEARLNALPQFVTTIEGVDIYFIHVRSPHPNAMPLIMTHGWPGSIIELLNAIDPLTNPTAHGGSAQDAFDVVIPSMPGYGFSGKPTTTGWNPFRIAAAWDILMKRLGYTRYVAQGGDWGAKISEALARQAPEGLLGIHMNLLLNIPPEIARSIAAGDPAPDGWQRKRRLPTTSERASLSPILSNSQPGPRRSATAWPTRRSGSRPGCSTTTPTVTSSSRTPLKDTLTAALRGIRSSTTLRCTG
jgi:pimeloyl-ACP methyl ester carboxylesterase